MTFTEEEQCILDALLDARAPRKAERLAEIIETTQPRLREVIRELRIKGVVVCSTSDGFFLASTSSQAEKTSRHLWSRVGKIAQVARAFDRARRKKFGEGFTRSEQIEIVFGRPETPVADEIDSLLESVV